MSLVTLNGQILDSVGLAYDGNGLAWCVTELQGWESGANAEVVHTPRSGAGGVVLGPSTYGGREIALKGIVQANSDTALAIGRQRLPAVFNIVRSPAVLVVNDAAPKQAEVVRDSPVSVSHTGWTLRYEVDLFSPDWRRFSLTDQTANTTISAGTLSQTLEVDNPGTAESHPVIEITGPAINPRLALMTTGEELELTGSLTAGAVLTIDFFTQTVLLNGAPADYVATGNIWWTIPPGTHDIRYRVVTSSAAASIAEVTFRPAWA